MIMIENSLNQNILRAVPKLEIISVLTNFDISAPNTKRDL